MRSQSRPAPQRAFNIAAIALAGLLAFGVCLQVSVAGIYRSKRPAVALRATPYDASARAKLAEQVASAEIANASATASALARDAIRRSPLEPAALRALAAVIPAAGAASDRRALPLMLAAQRLSRRELPTQMWLVDHYGRQRDAAQVVRQFDLALRSSESARATMFPLLDAAAGDPTLVRALLPVLRSRPNWAKPFATFVALYGTNPEFDVVTARMLLDGRRGEDRANYSALLHRLVQSGRQDLAWRAYTNPFLGLGGTAAAIRNGGFEAAEDTFPFDWTFAQEAELWASRERGPQGGTLLRTAAYNGRSGEVAWQIVHLAPGAHQLSAVFGDVPAPVLDRPQVTISCSGKDVAGRVLASLRPTSSGPSAQRLSSPLVVPANCPFQRISISVAGEGAQKDPLPYVDDISIR